MWREASLRGNSKLDKGLGGNIVQAWVLFAVETGGASCIRNSRGAAETHCFRHAQASPQRPWQLKDLDRRGSGLNFFFSATLKNCGKRVVVVVTGSGFIL